MRVPEPPPQRSLTVNSPQGCLDERRLWRLQGFTRANTDTQAQSRVVVWVYPLMAVRAYAAGVAHAFTVVPAHLLLSVIAVKAARIPMRLVRSQPEIHVHSHAEECRLASALRACEGCPKFVGLLSCCLFPALEIHHPEPTPDSAARVRASFNLCAKAQRLSRRSAD